MWLLIKPMVGNTYRTNTLKFAYRCVLIHLTLMLLVANLANTKWCKVNWKMIKTLEHGYSYKSYQCELSDEYQHDRVREGFQKSLRPCSLDESSLTMQDVPGIIYMKVLRSSLLNGGVQLWEVLNLTSSTYCVYSTHCSSSTWCIFYTHRVYQQKAEISCMRLITLNT